MRNATVLLVLEHGIPPWAGAEQQARWFAWEVQRIGRREAEAHVAWQTSLQQVDAHLPKPVPWDEGERAMGDDSATPDVSTTRGRGRVSLVDARTTRTRRGAYDGQCRSCKMRVAVSFRRLYEAADVTAARGLNAFYVMTSGEICWSIP